MESPIETSDIQRLGVIGDVHAEHERLAMAIDHLTGLGAQAMVCTGDIVDGIGCPNESVALLQQAEVVTVRGNHDRWVVENKARHVANAHTIDDLSEQTREYILDLPKQTSISTTGGDLMLCHGIGDDDLRKVWPGTDRMGVERSRKLDQIIDDANYRYIINGHMHFRTLIHFEALTLINAGTLKGEHWPGFSMIDFEDNLISAYEFTDNGVQLAREQLLIEDHHVIWKDTQAFSGNWEPVRLF